MHMILAAAFYYSTHLHIKMYLTISEAGKGIKCRGILVDVDRQYPAACMPKYVHLLAQHSLFL